MKFTRLIFLVFTLIFSSLGYAQEATQMQRVITAHDEAMDKMPHLVKLVNKLNPLVDSTQVGKRNQEAIDDLKTSNKSMMNWMQGFGERFTADEMMKGKTLSDKKKVWLNEEEIKIKALHDQINSSIKKAEELLKQ
ncbi:hypothetical protein [Maribacter sp. 2308TA10-17]|uniref:hypothetical protein n=1 Tax=Maribacter sp. 2308TA10-17 TaxID=3386276 RepID=UPI0039BD7761